MTPKKKTAARKVSLAIELRVKVDPPDEQLSEKIIAEIHAGLNHFIKAWELTGHVKQSKCRPRETPDRKS